MNPADCLSKSRRCWNRTDVESRHEHKRHV